MQKPLVHFVRIYFFAPMFDDSTQSYSFLLGLKGLRIDMLLSMYAQNSTFLTPPVFEIHLTAIISSPMLQTYNVKIRFNFKKVR